MGIYFNVKNKQFVPTYAKKTVISLTDSFNFILTNLYNNYVVIASMNRVKVCKVGK